MDDFRDWGFWSLPLTEAQIVSTHVSRLTHLLSFREIVKPVASRNWCWCRFASNPSFKDVWRPSSRCWWRQAAQKYRPRWLLTAVRQTAQLFWARNVIANHSLHFVNIVPWHRKYPAKQNPTTRMRYAWVTRPKRPKGAKDQVRQAQSPKSIISRSPETSRIQKCWLCLMLYSHSWNVFVLINHLQFG